jgi:NAD(P)-dependent dehydrogenase (short-subunit alcohol dehydrogenase family)
VDLHGVLYGTLAAYPIMMEQGFGHIVNTSSRAGLVPTPLNVPYCAAKYAVVGLSLSLRLEGADLGVKVSVVCPGYVRTPIFDTAVPGGPRPERLRRHADPALIPDQAVLDDHELRELPCTSIPIYRTNPALPSTGRSMGKPLGETTPTDTRSQRSRTSRRGGHLPTRAHSAPFNNGLPTRFPRRPLFRTVAP